MTQVLDVDDATLLSERETDDAEIALADDATSPARAPRREQFGQRQRKAREAALQVLFEVDLVGHEVADVRARQFDQMLLTEQYRAFAERLVEGVLAHRDALDTLIAEVAPQWPVAQLPRVDLNVLRLALCELLYSAEVPVGAVINEAVELAKRYGSENSGKFVNGALGTVAARINAGTLARTDDGELRYRDTADTEKRD